MQEHTKKQSTGDTKIEQIIFILGAGISLLHIYFNNFTVLPGLTQNE